MIAMRGPFALVDRFKTVDKPLQLCPQYPQVFPHPDGLMLYRFQAALVSFDNEMHLFETMLRVFNVALQVILGALHVILG